MYSLALLLTDMRLTQVMESNRFSQVSNSESTLEAVTFLSKTTRHTGQSASKQTPFVFPFTKASKIKNSGREIGYIFHS